MPLSAPRSAGLGLDDLLSGQLGADGIREFVYNPVRHGLADLLSQCIPGQERLATADLFRTKYKPGRKLTAYYHLHVGAEVRPIVLSWSAERQSDTMDAADLQDRAAPPHLVAPFERLSARTDDGHTGLLVAPIDPQMPQLMRLNDRPHLMSMLKNLAADSDVPTEPARIQALRYRPGQRHVLRVSSVPDHDHRAAFIKIDRDNRAAHAARFARGVGPLLSDRSPNTSLVRPLGYAAEEQAAVWRGIAGTSMSEEVRDPSRAIPLLGLIGKAVRVLHDMDRHDTTWDPTPEQLSAPHRAQAELTSTLGAGQHLSALIPALGARYRMLATEVVQRLEDLPAEDPRLGHGDLKCDNILAAGDRIFLLDLDRTGLLDPAIDLGKLFADLRWWGHHHSVDVVRLITGFLDGYGPCDPARLSRAHLVDVLFHLKHAARRIPVHAIDWDVQVQRHVGEVAAILRRDTT